MSLEVAIANLGASIDALTAKLEAHGAPPVKASAPAPAADKPQPVKTEASDKPEPVKYDADAVSAKVAINRAAVIALLDQYGVKKGSQVKEADLPKFMAELALIEKAAA